MLADPLSVGSNIMTKPSRPQCCTTLSCVNRSTNNSSGLNSGGTLPTAWAPNANVDPLDSPAVSAFYAVGPQLPGLVRQQWAVQPVSFPVTYWRSIGNSLWQLTGLGASLAPRGAQV
jgi:hypothetical protein